MHIRARQTYVGRLIGELGASGINLPVVNEGLECRVVDATLWPLNAMTTFRPNEPARYSNNLNMTMAPMFVNRNKNTYERLSPEVKAALDASPSLWSHSSRGRARGSAMRDPLKSRFPRKLFRF